ncbi:AraC family transcriptional regulator [Actinoplanes rectilineatus]|uniref:AraC family transcriptional regulator n=1 Tax=Actinoplanes rectilineatus TaxID=113571 RepID=UPI0005F2A365|nr:AraC family transcriptional regulator [Actinoplanes rectilineatus]
MHDDHLSRILELIEVRGVISGGFAAGGRWLTRFTPESPLKIVAVGRGSAGVTADGVTRSVLRAGDVAILNRRSSVTIDDTGSAGLQREFSIRADDPFLHVGASGTEAPDVVLGGHIEVDHAGEELMSRALPELVVVRSTAQDAEHLRSTLDRLAGEFAGDRLGRRAVLRLGGQLLLLDVLRIVARDATLGGTGWLRGLSDDRLRPALDLLHADLGRAWRLDDLARAAAMSRSSFAERFTATLGEPPVAYLTRLRMLTARRRLREDGTRISDLAPALGYSSESAFSAAFRREVGLSPRDFRTIATENRIGTRSSSDEHP